jgi:hypothetical protein
MLRHRIARIRRVGALVGLAAALVGSLPDPTRGQIELPVEPGARRALGLELQAYPAGLIGGVHGQFPLGDDLALTLRAGSNFTERRDWGEHHEEEGQGFGGGVGLRTAFDAKGRRWIAGARVDLWDLDIDWRDDVPARSGTTETLVVQPSIELGLRVEASTAWTLDFLLGLGMEINTDIQGEDVGEGWIFLVGVTALHGKATR